MDPTTRCPFVILIDSAEQHPFTFTGIQSDADRKYRTFIVEKRHICLGRHPDGYGDYSIEGFAGVHSNRGEFPAIGIERKSAEDLQGTILGWPDEEGRDDRRGRFEMELENLSRIDGWVVVESPRGDVIQSVPAHGKKSEWENAKILDRSILSYQARFRTVQWVFAESRRRAEVQTFRILYRFYEKEKEKRKQALKELATL